MRKYNYLSLKISELNEIAAIFNKNNIFWNTLNTLEEMALLDIGYQILFNQYPDTWKFGLARLTLEKNPLFKNNKIWIVCQTPEIMISEFQKLIKRRDEEKIKELVYTKIDTNKNTTFFIEEPKMKRLCNALKEAETYLENQFKGIRE